MSEEKKTISVELDPLAGRAILEHLRARQAEALLRYNEVKAELSSLSEGVMELEQKLSQQ